MLTPQYTSLEEKQKVFDKRYCVITTVSEFEDWYEEHKIRKDVKHIFRGVKEASYKNYTSAQRYYFQHDYKDCSLKDLVAAQITALRLNRQQLFQRYCYSFGVPCSDLFLLSFAQHHGGISPLLDFSPIVNTALFFMTHHAQFPNCGVGTSETEHISNYMSIYFLPRHSQNIPSISALFATLIKPYKSHIQITKNTPYTYWKKKIDEEGATSFSYENLNNQWPTIPIIIDESETWLNIDGNKYIGKVHESNLHLIAQQGCFVFHNNGVFPLEDDLYCVDIHKSLVPYIQKEILQEFFTEQTMFPNSDVLVANALEEASAQVIKSTFSFTTSMA